MPTEVESEDTLSDTTTLDSKEIFKDAVEPPLPTIDRIIISQEVIVGHIISEI